MALTKSDLHQIGEVVDQKLEERLDVRLGEKFEKLEVRLDKKFEKLEVRLDKKFEKLEVRLEERLDQKFEEKLDTKLTQLKSDFFDRIDPILKEVVASREERVIINARVDALETIHPNHKHVFGQN